MKYSCKFDFAELKIKKNGKTEIEIVDANRFAKDVRNNRDFLYLMNGTITFTEGFCYVHAIRINVFGIRLDEPINLKYFIELVNGFCSKEEIANLDTKISTTVYIDGVKATVTSYNRDKISENFDNHIKIVDVKYGFLKRKSKECVVSGGNNKTGELGLISDSEKYELISSDVQILITKVLG